MNRRHFNLVLITFIISAAATASGAETRWQTLAPGGQGFSIEIPGERQTNMSPDLYVYLAGLHSFTIFVQPVDAELWKLVGDRIAAVWCLEQVRDKMAADTNSTLLTSSPGEFDGYASLRFSNEGVTNGLALEGSYLMVLTERGLYVVSATAPKGLPNPHAERFFKSFQLVNTEAGSTTVRTNHTPTPSDPITARLAGPMLAVARLIIVEKLNPLIDDLLQSAPGTEGLGSRWNPSSEMWQRARSSISTRIARIADYYEQSGQIVALLESRLAGLSPDDLRTLQSALQGPESSALLRSNAAIVFISEVVSGDPSEPKVGSPAWSARATALGRVFEERIGPAMPRDERSNNARQDLSGPADDNLRSLWYSVVGKAVVDLKGAINLMMFDDRDAIQREVEAVIAGAK